MHQGVDSDARPPKHLDRQAEGRRWEPGDVVRLVGLASAPHLNGVVGRLERWEVDRGRWQVRLDGDAGKKLLRSHNLELVLQDSQDRQQHRRQHKEAERMPAEESSQEPEGLPTFCIAGTWNNFSPTPMVWDGSAFVHTVQLGQNSWESFQILANGSWENTFYPDMVDGNPHTPHRLLGPDHQGHGRNWTVGRHPDDAGEPGKLYTVELRIGTNGQPESVTWNRGRRRRRGFSHFSSKEAQQPRADVPFDSGVAAGFQQEQGFLRAPVQMLCARCGKSEARSELWTNAEQCCDRCWALQSLCVICQTVDGDLTHHGYRYCAACWLSTSCSACREATGIKKDSTGNNYCETCWRSNVACVMCKSKEGSESDKDGQRFCTACWSTHIKCIGCKISAGHTRDRNGHRFCADCWDRNVLCSMCRAVESDHRDAKGKVYCSFCWPAVERERLEASVRGQARVLQDYFEFAKQAAAPTQVEFEAGSAAKTVAEPLPSPTQGTLFMGGYEFTSEFDGGNAVMESWALESDGGTEGMPTFGVQIANDREGNSGERARTFWFSFGIRPLDPKASVGASFRIAVHGMSRISDLRECGYAPVSYTPSRPQWQRIDAETLSYDREGVDKTFTVSWPHKLEEIDSWGYTYFAFCYPFSFSDLQLCLASIDRTLASSCGQEAKQQPELGCFHQGHIACACCADCDDIPKPVPRVGLAVYFHRQVIARTPQGRIVEVLTVTEAAASLADSGPYDELPTSVLEALGDMPSAPPLRFVGRRVFFASARVHPGETPGQFVLLGLLQFLLSDDPRAALLRASAVFKLVPMLNPDGVAWGHSRTNSLGHDLNRCYNHAVPEQHEGVAAVIALLHDWAAREELALYVDCHAHANSRGCFLYGNNVEDKLLLESVTYAHVMQTNCPHLDIDQCLWSTAPAPKVGLLDYDSGRGYVGRSFPDLPHAYTLECNYNTGHMSRPTAEPIGLPWHAVWTQALRQPPIMRGRSGRFAPVAYDPCAWAAVGEAVAVALLDLFSTNPYSRLLSAQPPKHFRAKQDERAHSGNILSNVHQALNLLRERHRVAADRQKMPPM